MERELKVCPFCGSKDVHVWHDQQGGWYKIVHPQSKCFLTYNRKAYPTRLEAVERWNSRAIPSTTDLRKVLEPLLFGFMTVEERAYKMEHALQLFLREKL